MKISPHRTEAEWLAARCRKLTSSDIPPLLGIYPSEESKKYKNPFETWMVKTGKKPDPEVEHMRLRFDLGHLVEDRVAREVEEKTEGVHLVDLGDYTIVSEGILAATPDRLIVPAGLGGNWTAPLTTSEEAALALTKMEAAIECSTGPCEIKSDGVIHDAAEWSGGEKFSYALVQAHVPTMIMGKQGGLIAVVLGLGLGFEVTPFVRSPKLCSLIEERAGEFWESVLSDVPPSAKFIDSGEAIAKSLATLFGGDSGETVELDEAAALQMEHLEDVKEKINALEAEKSAIENAVRHRMGSATWATIPGAKKKWQWKTEPRKAYTKEVPASEPRVLRLVKA